VQPSGSLSEPWLVLPVTDVKGKLCRQSNNNNRRVVRRKHDKLAVNVTDLRASYILDP
jgi:hypothetical protein